jgi:hypothetical protein
MTSGRGKRRFFQYSLRTLLLAMAVVAGVFGWWLHRARSHARAVAAIRSAGGMVLCEYNVRQAGPWDFRAESPTPKWLRRLVGEDGLSTVVIVELGGIQVDWKSMTFRRPRGDVTDADLAPLGTFKKLRHLGIRSERVTDEGLAPLQELTAMETLSIQCPKVSDDGLAHVAGMTRLESLRLDGAAVTDDGLVHLSGMTNLQTLYLVKCDVTDAGLDHLAGLKRLRYVFLVGTQVTDEGASKLEEALPNATILHDGDGFRPRMP